MYTDCTHVRLERKTIWHNIAYLLASDHIKVFEVYIPVLAYLIAYLEEEPYTPLHSNHHSRVTHPFVFGLNPKKTKVAALGSSFFLLAVKVLVKHRQPNTLKELIS